MLNQLIRLGDANDFVEMEVLAFGTRASQGEGDLRLRVAAQEEEFSGTYKEVWIAKDEWDTFIRSLTLLELKRSGTALLFSMSPDEFELHLEITDVAGHLKAHGFLSRYHFGSGTRRSRIEYCVTVDPSMLRELLIQFTAFGRADDPYAS